MSDQEKIGVIASIRGAIFDTVTAIVANSIAIASPQRAGEYRHQRAEYKRSYVAANLKGPYQGHRPTNKSGDAEVMANQRAVTTRVRDMERNNPLVKGITLKNATMVVGDEIGVKFQILDRSGVPDKTINQELEKRFYRWAETAMISGESLTDAAHFIENHLVLDGEIISRNVFDDSMGGNPFRVQILETDYLDTSKGVFGIEFLANGKPKTFNFYTQHPSGLDNKKQSTVPVLAEDVMLLAEVTRSSQKRGISPLAAAVYKLYGVDDLEDAELVASRAACAFGLVINSPNPETIYPQAITSVAAKDEAGKSREYLDAGGVLRITGAESVTSFKNERPNSNFEPFIRGRERKAAGSQGMSYETATGDYSQVNYSSAKMGKNIEWANIRRRQARLRKWLNFVVRMWLKYELLTVGVKSISIAQYVKDPSMFEEFTFQLAGNDGIDPTKEISALMDEIALGVNSRTRYCAEKGRDRVQVAKEIQEETQDMRDRKIFQLDPTVLTSGFMDLTQQEPVK